jgi:hypothetical protein
MEFKKLFQRNTSGSVQRRQIFVVGAEYCTISGKKDRKLVTSANNMCQGKILEDQS